MSRRAIFWTIVIASSMCASAALAAAQGVVRNDNPCNWTIIYSLTKGSSNFSLKFFSLPGPLAACTTNSIVVGQTASCLLFSGASLSVQYAPAAFGVVRATAPYPYTRDIGPFMPTGHIFGGAGGVSVNDPSDGSIKFVGCNLW